MQPGRISGARRLNPDPAVKPTSQVLVATAPAKLAATVATASTLFTRSGNVYREAAAIQFLAIQAFYGLLGLFI
jgi:hypothetical protein